MLYVLPSALIHFMLIIFEVIKTGIFRNVTFQICTKQSEVFLKLIENYGPTGTNYINDAITIHLRIYVKHLYFLL